MRVIEFRQNLLYRFLLTPAHFAMVELTCQRNKGVQSRSGAATCESGQDIDQHLFVGGKVSNDVLDRPDTACSWSFPGIFGEAIDGREYCGLSILQNVCCVHVSILSAYRNPSNTSSSSCLPPLTRLKTR